MNDVARFVSASNRNSNNSYIYADLCQSEFYIDKRKIEILERDIAHTFHY